MDSLTYGQPATIRRGWCGSYSSSLKPTVLTLLAES